MLPEVVAQIATFLENCFAALEPAPKEQPDTIRVLVPHLDCLVPTVRDSGQSLADTIPTRLLLAYAFAFLSWRQRGWLAISFCGPRGDVIRFLPASGVTFFAFFTVDRVLLGPVTL